MLCLCELVEVLKGYEDIDTLKKMLTEVISTFLVIISYEICYICYRKITMIIHI